MTSIFFLIIAAIYWIMTLTRVLLWSKTNHLWEQICSAFEKISLILFTAGIVFYIHELHIINGVVQPQNYAEPVSLLLFTWCINAANLVSELMYGNKFTAVFSNAWTGLALSLLPRLKSEKILTVFNNDVQWLGIHRLFFLLGYAFCILALPLALQYLWKSLRHNPDAGLLWLIDRMSYRMILWALPLLTAGIVIEALLLIEHHQLPSLNQIWDDRKEAFLAVATWFICGVYLHSRIFFAWKNRRSAFLYLAGFLLILAGHFGSRFF